MTQITQGPMGDIPDLHVVAAVIFLDGRIMAAKRLAGGPSGFKWEFPGGKVEAGEQPESALAREVAEELGMVISVCDELGSFTTPLGRWRVRLHCFTCETTHAPTKLEAHSEVLWCDPEDLRAIDWALPDIPAVEALLARLAQQ